MSREVIIALIADATTRAGLKIRAELDTSQYPTGTKVTDEELALINLKRNAFHSDWNYTLMPPRRKS